MAASVSVSAVSEPSPHEAAEQMQPSEEKAMDNEMVGSSAATSSSAEAAATTTQPQMSNYREFVPKGIRHFLLEDKTSQGDRFDGEIKSGNEQTKNESLNQFDDDTFVDVSFGDDDQ